jgi:cysteine-rich repeat protein
MNKQIIYILLALMLIGGVSALCTDTDGGKNYNVKGTITYNYYKYTDYCSGNYVREYYCSYGRPYITSSSCAYGCNNGACKPKPISVCGNNVLETGEQCDDGNSVNGDGCSNICKIESAPLSNTVALDDAFVYLSLPDSNFGSATYLDAGTTPNTEAAFLKFSLEGASNIVQSAQLCLNVINFDGSNSPTNAQMYEVSNQEWNENSITWNNQPIAGNLIDSKIVTSDSVWYCYDIKAWAQTEINNNHKNLSVKWTAPTGFLRSQSKESPSINVRPKLNLVTIPSVCGDGILTLPQEQCELPGTVNNVNCPQSTTICSDNHKVTRDGLGICNNLCKCITDEFTNPQCIKGECAAQCAVDIDCDDSNPSTIDKCSEHCLCTYSTDVWVYKENADSVYYTSGWLNQMNIYDGDWVTYGNLLTIGAEIYFNYSVPSGTSQINWQTTMDDYTTNVSLDGGCIINPLQLRLNGYLHYGLTSIRAQCWNGIAWKTPMLQITNKVNEEGVWFKVG